MPPRRYIQETLGIHELEPMYRQFARIFETFRISDPVKLDDPNDLIPKEPLKEYPPDLKKVPRLEDEYDDDDIEEDENKKQEEKTKLSKRKLKKLTRLSVAELKQLVTRPDVVEMHDVTARDPKLLVQLKAHRNTVPVPRHWCFKRKYLQGKRGIEKPPFDLPEFIKKTGIMEMRAALQEKEDQRTLKAKMRERARPKLGKIDIDYQKLHDAFFKWQTKPRMSIHGDLYYEGKEFETRLKEKKPGDLTDELRTALGMPTGPNAHKVPPPWLIAMQRYGPPPSYPNLKIAGLNAPIPEGCSFGYHAGGWGKPPVDENGRPLYGDVFGIQVQDLQAEPEDEEVDTAIWGELESESEEESEEEEDEDEEGGGKEDDTGLVTPVEGLITPSGITSIPAGMETPEIIELRKRKIESEMEGSVDYSLVSCAHAYLLRSTPRGETPALFQVLPEKRMDRVGGAMMASTHIYDMTGAGAPPPAPVIRRGGLEGSGTVELALDPSELDLVDTDAMAVRYEQQIREQQSQLQKEDLSDMLADHVARQKSTMTHELPNLFVSPQAVKYPITSLSLLQNKEDDLSPIEIEPRVPPGTMSRFYFPPKPLKRKGLSHPTLREFPTFSRVFEIPSTPRNRDSDVVTLHKVYGNTLPAKATRSTNSRTAWYLTCSLERMLYWLPMNVQLSVVGQVIVDDERHLLYINTSCPHVCGDENAATQHINTFNIRVQRNRLRNQLRSSLMVIHPLKDEEGKSSPSAIGSESSTSTHVTSRLCDQNWWLEKKQSNFVLTLSPSAIILYLRLRLTLPGLYPTSHGDSRCWDSVLPPTATHVAGTLSYLPRRLTLPGLYPTSHRDSHCRDSILPPTATPVLPVLLPSTSPPFPFACPCHRRFHEKVYTRSSSKSHTSLNTTLPSFKHQVDKRTWTSRRNIFSTYQRMELGSKTALSWGRYVFNLRSQ
uniref:PSP proline-rich domain-containing protein n=1 Tax=Timema cristinae TaxID=61476 RepID=A0A7R9GVX4_TIMCR|nr:unnamed protein product [Timema cristinae]